MSRFLDVTLDEKKRDADHVTGEYATTGAISDHVTGEYASTAVIPDHVTEEYATTGAIPDHVAFDCSNATSLDSTCDIPHNVRC